jgi:hypothetical protein
VGGVGGVEGVVGESGGDWAGPWERREWE